MGTTVSDIMEFLKAEQKTRAKEKEEDKIIRAQERKEDMDHILTMITAGVKAEVETALKPLEERLQYQEQVSKGLHNKVKSLMTELKDLKGKVRQAEEFPGLPGPQAQPQVQQLLGDRSQAGSPPRNQRVDEVEKMCEAGRKVIGFSPIEPRMLDIQIQSYGAKNQEEAMLMEKKSYLKCEMKVRPSDIDTLDIVRIFPPAKENWNVLYVEFGSELQVEKLMTYTRGMVKQDHRVLRWFPKEMYERYRAVESIAYDIRKTSNQKTRVKLGRNDIELHVRELGSRYWRRQTLPDNLPEIDMEPTSRPSLVASPPPGRPYSSPL